MQQKYGARGFIVVAVNVDKKRADADRFLAQLPANFHRRVRRFGRDADRLRRQGHAQFVPDRRPAATSCPSSAASSTRARRHSSIASRRCSRRRTEGSPECGWLLAILGDRRARGLRDVRAAQALGKGQLARPEMQFDYDRLDARDAEHIYTSKEARDRRLRRRRRRLWLQLKAAGRCSPPRWRSQRVRARRVPRCARAGGARQGHLFEFQYLNYRDWQPGRNRMKVDAPVVLRAGAAVRYVGGRRRRSSTTR